MTRKVDLKMKVSAAMDKGNKEKIKDLKKEVRKLSKKNKRLRNLVGELSTLNDLSLAISGNVDSEKVIRTIIKRSIRSIGAEQGNITLINENYKVSGKTLVGNSKNHPPLYLNQNLLEWMQINKKPLLINDPPNDSRFQNVEWEESIHSILSAPLMNRSNLIGILTLFNKEDDGSFTKDDEQLLSIIASQSAQVFENARLHEEEQDLKNMRQEVELAGKIQKQLLPKEQPDIKQYSLCGRNITAHSVGGDYYDFIQLDNNRWAICLGDVSGKGLPASLLMSNLQAILRGQVIYQPLPGVLLKHANRQLYQITNSEKFVTLFLGILDVSSHTLQYSIGGHEYPFLLHSDSSHKRLRTGGIPMGIMENQEYEQETVEFNPGDKLVIYSDGIIDSRNSEDEEFGEARLEKLLIENSNQSAQQLLDSIFDASLEHSKGPQPFDDMTMVVVSRNS